MDDAVIEMGKSLVDAYSNMWRDTVRKDIPDIDDWKYVDTPHMSQYWWNELVEMLGEGNYIVVAGSRSQDSVRATMFISPVGVANSSKYLEAQRATPK